MRETAAHVLGIILRLLHPAMPFVTEELWDRFGYGAACSLIRAAWPEPVAVADAAAAREELDWVVRLISEVRSVRTEMNVPPGTLTPILLRDAAPETLARGQRWIEAIRRLARASELEPLTGEMPKGSAQPVLDEATVVLPLADVIDLGAERARLARERDKAAGEMRKIVQKLDNADFVSARRKRSWRKTASAWQPRKPTSRGWRRRWDASGSGSCALSKTGFGSGLQSNAKRVPPKDGASSMAIDVIAIQPVVALIAGILILIIPRLLNIIVAVYLIIVGITGLWPHLLH